MAIIPLKQVGRRQRRGVGYPAEMRTMITVSLCVGIITAFAFAAFVATAIQSDIQLILIAICVLGGCILGGILGLMEGQEQILKKLK